MCEAYGSERFTGLSGGIERDDKRIGAFFTDGYTRKEYPNDITCKTVVYSGKWGESKRLSADLLDFNQQKASSCIRYMNSGAG